MSDTKNDTDLTYYFLKKVVIFVFIALSVTLLVIFIGNAITTLLLIFAGVLLGIIFRVIRDFIHQTTHLPNGFSLALVMVLFISISFGTVYLLGPQLYKQGQTFYDEVPGQWETLKKEIAPYGWGKEIAQENPHFWDLFENENNGTGEDHDMTKSALIFFGNITAILASLLLVFVIAIYIAAEPKLYSEGFVRLFPHSQREKVLKIMDEISLTIQWWLVGQLCSMIILGTLATLGLWLLGVPYPLLLGAFTALMTFIPNLGPIIAAIPILLVSLTIGVDTAIYTGVFYTVLQCIEGYFITPMIHRRAISVPPVLIITVQFLLYYLIGFLGVLFAMPLMGCIMVLVKRLYIEDILGDPLEEHVSHDLEDNNIF